MQIDVNTTRPAGERVISIRVKEKNAEECKNSSEECTPAEYKPIDLNRSYRIVAPDFLAKGGNGYTIFTTHGENYV